MSEIFEETQRQEMAKLRAEVAELRKELAELRAGLSGEAAKPLHLRVASLQIVGDSPSSPSEAVPRFQIVLSIEKDGGQIQFLDTQSGVTQAALVVASEGTSLALCGDNGVPRVVLTARSEGGGISLLDENGNLASELFGAGEASWLMLNHDGAPRAISVAVASGGNLELFGEEDLQNPLLTLPLGSKQAYSPE